MINLFDTFNQSSFDLHASLQKAGYTHPTIVLEDDGFLPADVDSPYRYFMRESEVSQVIRPRYFNEVNKPLYMEIKGTNAKAEIYDYDRLAATIYYSKPSHKRLVRRVDWYDRSKKVRRVDCYNLYGRLFAEIIFDNQQKKAMTRYFDIDNREVIVENHLTGDIILTEGKQVSIFQSKKEFVIHYLRQTGYKLDRIFYNSLALPFQIAISLGDEGSDILFWQEPIHDVVPGNMEWLFNSKSYHQTKVVAMRHQTYERLLDLTAEKHHNKLASLGYIYHFKKENKGQGEALVFTNSDQLQSLQELVTSLPEVKFHIAAMTEMSSKLSAFERHTNVHLYPNIKHNQIEKLLLQADIYLDINFGNEILLATRQAFEYNLLLLGFDNTAHSRTYLAPSHIFQKNNAQGMIDYIIQVLSSTKAMKEAIDKQHQAADTIKVEDYHDLIG